VRNESYHNYQIVKLDFSESMLYDGSQIRPLYTFERYGVLGNSILIFRGGMRLTPDEMIDVKDIIRESHLAEVLISSDDTLHFIIEEFDTQPPNIEIVYYHLRLLTTIVIEVLYNRGITPNRKGTDIYIEGKKLNVGIASISGNSSKIHFGINILDTGVPNHVNAIGLHNLGIKEEELDELAIQIAKRYVNELFMVKEDIAKTRELR